LASSSFRPRIEAAKTILLFMPLDGVIASRRIIPFASFKASSAEKLSMPPVVMESTSPVTVLIFRPSLRRTRARYLPGDIRNVSIA
jgi:hypothetical protein